MSSYNESPALLGIGTAVPEHRVDQREAAQRMAAALEHLPSAARWARRIFRQVAVENRYTCEASLANLAASGIESRYFPNASQEQVPLTSERMSSYEQHSVGLASDAALQAMEESGVAADDITHLMAVSCTGMFLPGLDVALIRRLGLSKTTRRLPLIFMGCAAGLTAIRTAAGLVKEDSTVKVLIVCVELCTLHIQPNGEKEALFGAAFFGDGASACVVGHVDKSDKGLFRLGNGRTVLFPEGAEDMVWKVGNFGFDLFLSPVIPKLIENYLPQELEWLLRGEEASDSKSGGEIASGESSSFTLLREDEDGSGQQTKPPLAKKPELWAIHPGGKGIIDSLQEIYGLTAEQTAPSREILRQYGNMSSATILFVLKSMLEQLHDEDAQMSGLSLSRSGVAIGFGPGLHAELLELTYEPSLFRAEMSHEVPGENRYVEA